MPRARPLPPSLKVLFIGNSFTARNDLPGLIERLAAARGCRFEHRLISAGGASLRMHWDKGVALEAIRGGNGEAGPWDFVVLQEQSTLPIKNRTRMHENVRLFDDAIRSAGSKTALYVTWARAGAPAPQTQESITEAYTSIGREIGAILVPVGVAWQRFLAAHKGKPPVALHALDRSHPTLAGSYLAACVFFTTLFDESPAGVDVTVKGLNGDEMRMLQRAAVEMAP
jgi:hypothetical protein